MQKHIVIDPDGYVAGISYLYDAVESDTLIAVDDDFDPTNKRWNGTSWEEYTPPDPPEPEPTQLDRIEAAANMKNADIAQAAIDEYTLELVKEGVL